MGAVPCRHMWVTACHSDSHARPVPAQRPYERHFHVGADLLSCETSAPLKTSIQQTQTDPGCRLPPFFLSRILKLLT